MQPNSGQQSLRTALRIAVVTETYPPEINGVARTVGLMVEALLARGHDVQLIRPRQAADGRGAPATHAGRLAELLTLGVSIPKYAQLQLGVATPGRLRASWQDARPDLVQIVTEGPLGWAALLAAHKLGIPVITDFHTNFHDYSRHYGLGWTSSAVLSYLRAFHNRAACTLVPTREMRERLGALRLARLEIVGRGIDATLFHPARRDAALRRAWGCSADTPVALYVGRLGREKNLGLFVRAMRLARCCRPDLRAVVVGDGPMRAELQANNPDILFAGMRKGEDLASHYASADLFVFPSLSETFGNVTMEAMASGLAVVAFDYAAAREHIVHGRNGLLAACDDEKLFRELVLRLVLSPREMREMGARARRTAEQLRWARTFDDLEQLMLQVIDTAAGDAMRQTRALHAPGRAA